MSFDEKLRHYADKQISLDLDDGAKVNYGKIGDLLAEVKAVTGKKTKPTTDDTNLTNEANEKTLNGMKHEH